MRVKHSSGTQFPEPSEINDPDEQARPHRIEPVHTSFRFLDFLVLIICLSGIFFFFHLFRQDMLQTIKLQNIQPVGNVIIKLNVVQRRVANRVLWDRLSNESSIYIGDIIRAADLSSAALNIEGQQINLSENTLIRIQRSADGEGLQIELSEGNISVSTNDEGANLQFNLMGRVVEPSHSSEINLSAGNDGIVIEVSKGNVMLADGEKEDREFFSPAMIVIDNEGTERRVPSVVVTSPRSNAHYLNSTKEPLPVSFIWDRINFRPDDYLRLEIAEDRNFISIIRTINNLSDTVSFSFNSGVWHWRLSLYNDVLSSGRITVADISAPELISPIKDSVIRYQNDPPLMRFQWSDVKEASRYFLEVSLLPDFSNIQIRQETTATSFNAQGMGQGAWYWRVTPLFSSGFEGGTSLTAVSQFRVEQNRQETQEVNEEIILPAPPPAPLELRLISPEDGANLAGLSALRSGAVFRWESDRNAASSRFILSGNSDPFEQPMIDIANPGTTVQISRIQAGTWYWTVQATSDEGFVSTAQPQRLQVLSIPLLQAPGNLQPPNGYRIRAETLRSQQSIVFSWQAVNGANAYIFTLYERAGNGRRRILRSSPVERTRWTLENMSILSRNTFYWQVEAVNINQDGVIVQTGIESENFFTVEIPLPEVQAIKPGVLYGQ